MMVSKGEGVGRWAEWEIQASIYRITKSQAWKVQHGENSQWCVSSWCCLGTDGSYTYGAQCDMWMWSPYVAHLKLM